MLLWKLCWYNRELDIWDRITGYTYQNRYLTLVRTTTVSSLANIHFGSCAWQNIPARVTVSFQVSFQSISRPPNHHDCGTVHYIGNRLEMTFSVNPSTLNYLLDLWHNFSHEILFIISVSDIFCYLVFCSEGEKFFRECNFPSGVWISLESNTNYNMSERSWWHFYWNNEAGRCLYWLSMVKQRTGKTEKKNESWSLHTPNT